MNYKLGSSRLNDYKCSLVVVFSVAILSVTGNTFLVLNYVSIYEAYYLIVIC